MKKIFWILSFLSLSLVCFSQQQREKTINEWKMIQNADATQDVFERSAQTILRQDTTFVDSLFKETFTSIEMYGGDRTDKYSFITQNTGTRMNIKTVDIYTFEGKVFLAIIYYDVEKKFYDKHYYNNEKASNRLLTRGMRVTDNNLDQFIGIVKSMMGK